MADRTLVVRIVGDSSSLSRELRKSERSAKGLGASFLGLSRSAKLGLAGAAVGGTALLGKQLKDSAVAARDAQAAQARLKQALASTGASFKTHGKAIDRVIQRTSKLAALDDEDLSDAFAKLVRTTGDVNRAMEDMALAADIARGRNISLEQATKIVEKAEVGQLRGLKAIGVAIGKNTTSTEALERAQKKFAGSAARYGNTAAGAQDKLSVAFENLQEKVGEKVLPVLQKLALRLVDLIDWAEANWPRFRNAIDPVVKAVKGFGTTVEVMFRIVRPILGVYFGKVLPVQLKIAGKAIEAVGFAVTTMGRVIGKVISIVLVTIDKFLGGIQAMVEAASKLPFVGDQFQGIADKIGNARKNVRDLNASLNAINGKTVSVTVLTKNLQVYDALEGRRGSLPGRTGASRAPQSRSAGSVTHYSGPIIVQANNPAEMEKQLQRRARRTSGQTRGPSAGNPLGLGG